MIKACIFDLDGTILDTITSIAHYGNLALKEFGIEPIEKEHYNFFAGNGAKILIRRMLEYRNCFSEELFNKVYPFYMKSYDANPTYLTEPFDGICELLKKLNSLGVSSAVISNKPDFAARSVCKEKFESGLLDVVRGQVEGVRIKPDTQGVLLVVKELGVNADEVIYVGDTDVDMQTGKNLGAYTIGVLWGFRKEDELLANGADELVSHPMEIAHIIERKNKI